MGGGSGTPGGTEAQARELCLRLLADRARSRAELAGMLAKRGFSDPVADRVLTRFVEVGLIDDRALAEGFVRSRHARRGLARRALTAELVRRGVTDDVAAEAVSVLDDDAEAATARGLVRRRLTGSGVGADPTASMRRLAGMLARRGYPAGLAYRVVREELAACGADVPEAPGIDGGDGVD
ncbi:MAG: regulatory protein RecX [Actinobacteria bacterium]|nr:regulatory protein RecX [Actinomycetota bacterium]